MTSRIALRTLVLSVSCTLAFAASPIATISSSGSFELRGVAVKTEGVPSWPVLAGGSSVMLSEQAFARVEKAGKRVSFRLLDGSMQVTAAKGPAVNFYNNDKSVDAKAGSPVRVSTKGATLRQFRPELVKPCPTCTPPPISGQ